MSKWHYAFSLSKSELAEAEPPGTERLIEHELHRTQTGTAYNEDHIQLIPHPSNSKADPLNWPQWRKLAILFTVSLFAALSSMSSSILAPAIPIMQYQLRPIQSLSSLSHLIAVNVLLQGTSNIFWVPLSNTFGRRPVVILSMVVLLAGSVWAGRATTFTSLLAARAVQGFGSGPGDTIAPDIAGEIFFVHQRGRALAIYTLFLGSGSFIGGVAGGYIAGGLGYQYVFYIPAALTGFNLLCQIFLVPETLFDRASHMRQDSHADVGSIDETEKGASSHNEHAVHSATQGSFTYMQSLKIGGVYRGQLLQNFIAPWRSLLFPGTWVVMLHYGGLLGGIVTMSTVAPILLAQPPYLWGNNVGLISVAPIIGNCLGGLSTYFVADWLMTRGAKSEQHGLAEPEYRLPAMFPALILATAGIWCFGFSAASSSPHAWIGMAFGFGMNGFGIVQIPSVGFNYLIESYNAISGDCFVMTTISRAVVSFAWTFFVTNWIEKDGVAEPFGIFGMLMAIFGLLTIPLWLYGKRTRIATAAHLPAQGHH